MLYGRLNTPACGSRVDMPRPSPSSSVASPGRQELTKLPPHRGQANRNEEGGPQRQRPFPATRRARDRGDHHQSGEHARTRVPTTSPNATPNDALVRGKFSRPVAGIATSQAAASPSAIVTIRPTGLAPRPAERSPRPVPLRTGCRSGLLGVSRGPDDLSRRAERETRPERRVGRMNAGRHAADSSV